ncbi:MAG: hypothetical protein J6A74_02450 [Oscillospiraceae bacterium]|nr:hypothetical protein [Oscillospiraceae bacterium]
MAFVLDLKLLRDNLDQSSPRIEMVGDGLDDPELGFSEGLIYLIRNVIIPLTRKEKINSANLDFSKFTDEDLADLYDYYNTNYYDGSSSWYKLKAFYQQCCKAPSQAAPIRFL